MDRQRTRLGMMLGGCAVIAAAFNVASGSRSENAMTEERIANEIVGDPLAAGCVVDGLEEWGIDPSVLDLMLSADVSTDEALINQDVLDGVSEIITKCGSVSVVDVSADGSTVLSELDLDRDGGVADAAPPTTLPEPIVVVAEDGAAEVVDVPSTELVRIDPDIPEQASNRSP